MHRFDYIIVGAGLSGSTLLLTIFNSPLRAKKILLIDNHLYSTKQQRLWSFWTHKEHVLSPIITKRWNNISIAGDTGVSLYHLASNSLQLLQSSDLHRYVYQSYEKKKSVKVMNAEVKTVFSNFAHAGVQLNNNEQYIADYVFDSSSLGIPFMSNPPGVFGWTWDIHTRRDSFDSSSVTLFDFRCTPRDRFSFFYLLPQSPRHATITLSQFGYKSDMLSQSRSALNRYLSAVMHIRTFHVTDESFAFIPVAQSPQPRNPEHRIMPIGSRAGLVNSLTSYAAAAIINDCEQIVNALVTTGRPFFNGRPLGYSSLNRLMMKLTHTNPDAARRLFQAVFEKNPNADRVLSFINQEEPLHHYTDLLRRINPLPLVGALMGV